MLRTAFLCILATVASAQDIFWRPLQTGVEYAKVDGLHIVRVSPDRAKLTVALASEAGAGPRTAAQWCRKSNLAVAINAGMFKDDHVSNVGYLRHGKHHNNPRWNDYRAVVAIGPSVRWFDIDDARPSVDAYDIVIQNLRLLTTARKNVWSKSDRRWSEAALAIDGKGRLLFVFSRAPHTMRDFNRILLDLPLDVAGAMHLEGGPEASLSIHAGDLHVDLAGSYETNFWPRDDNHEQWAIPNVLGVVKEK